MSKLLKQQHQVPAAPPPPDVRQVERAIVFTDIVGSTAIMLRLGDRRGTALMSAHDHLARRIYRTQGGFEVDRTDGFFLLFRKPAAAAEIAIGYHAALRQLGVGWRVQLQARVGIHFGTLLLRANQQLDRASGARNLEADGIAKSLAARIMSLALPEQTLVSAAACAQLAHDRPPARCLLRYAGEHKLRGLTAPIHLHVLIGGRAA